MQSTSCRGEYKKILRNAQRDYYLDFLDLKLDENGKYLFNHIKRLKKDSIGIEVLKYKDKTVTNAEDKVEALAEEYEKVFVNENIQNLPNILPSPYPDMEEFEVTENGVLSQLNNLNVYKSTGPDDLSPFLLKMVCWTILKSLINIFDYLI